jgi:AMMECR1 domain-containing protein
VVAHVSAVSPAQTPGAARAEVLERPGGAFVTIHKHGELRGCIGHVEANVSVSVSCSNSVS